MWRTSTLNKDIRYFSKGFSGNKKAYAGPHTALGWNIYILIKTIVGFRILEYRNLHITVGPVVAVLVVVLVLAVPIKIVEPTLQCSV